MDRFLLAENPMNKDGRIYIIHTVDPKCIIEVIDFFKQGKPDDATNLPSKNFFYINHDGISESWLLVIRDQCNKGSDKGYGALLDRAWRWYRSYLDWEDDNIDEKEDSQWN